MINDSLIMLWLIITLIGQVISILGLVLVIFINWRMTALENTIENGEVKNESCTCNRTLP